MPHRATEELHPHASDLDARPPVDAARLLAEAQAEAAKVVAGAAQPISLAAAEIAAAFRGGGSLYYIAAGSSGLMALADAAELGGTFGISSDRIRIVMAGGIPRSAHMPGETEDAVAGLATELSAIGPGDVAIALSASGSTPFTLAGMERARKAGAKVIGLANVPQTPVLTGSDIAICLPTPPEMVAGSTRLGAGTAQKIALNTLSTLTGILLGHVHAGRMVNLRADNAKLRSRALHIVRDIGGVSAPIAETCLEQADHDVKIAVLLASGAGTKEQAAHSLRQSAGHLRPALAALDRKPHSKHQQQ